MEAECSCETSTNIYHIMWQGSFFRPVFLSNNVESAAEWHKLVCLGQMVHSSSSVDKPADRYGSKSNLFDKFLAVQVNEGRTPDRFKKECSGRWNILFARSLSVLYRTQDTKPIFWLLSAQGRFVCQPRQAKHFQSGQRPCLQSTA
jgi:hypothetical protein